VAETEERLQIRLYHKRDITLVRGEGVYLWDAHGRRYLDMMSNYGINVLGHQHPAVTAAIIDQAGRLTGCHQSFYSDVRAKFLGLLANLLPESLERVSFSNSGAEAIEAALKFARAASGRSRIIATHRGYHGRTMGALSVTGEPKHRAAYEPLLPHVEHVPFGDLDAIQKIVAGAAAIVVEPVQGESGVRPAPDGYLEGLRNLCDESGALLILDEVQTAFRTGRTWAFEHSGAAPDIMALSKPLANGLPIGITAVSGAVAEAIPAGSHGTTFGGNPLVCAVGVATLRTVSEPGFNQHATDMGRVFLGLLREIRHPLVREVRGLGLMIGVELKRNATPVLRKMQSEGVLAIPAGSTAVRFLPPLIVQEGHVREAVKVFAESLD
jgi:acetylornithine/LysW-gamma-L-lysine aminotransferase